MDIYGIDTCKFTDKEFHDFGCRLIRTEYVEWYCLIDFDKSIATNLFTGEQVYIISQDNKNRILKSEFNKIEMYTNYGLNVRKINLKSLSKREQLKITLAYLKYEFLSRVEQKRNKDQKEGEIAK